MNLTLKAVSSICILLISGSSLATNSIKVTVKTSLSDAAAIGFTVNGSQSGGLGKTYTGHGPLGQEYVFGYRKKSPFGPNITCGSLVLSQPTTVVLVTQDNTCNPIVAESTYLPPVHYF